MLFTEQLFFVTEIIGTIAFAFSGAMVAVEKRMDIFGVLVLGGVTAVGGGCIRDMILGVNPPAFFVKPIYVTVAALTSLLVFAIIYYRHKMFSRRSAEGYLRLIDLLDAVGLGAFTVVGVDAAMNTGFADNRFLMVFVGVLTGVGGGILRDILAGLTPTVLRKRIYAIASIIGAFLYIYSLPVLGHTSAMLLAALCIVAIRWLAAHYRWNLPVAVLMEDE